jgi:hypothetical protein
LGCALGGPIFSLFLSFSLSPCFLATMNWTALLYHVFPTMAFWSQVTMDQNL